MSPTDLGLPIKSVKLVEKLKADRPFFFAYGKDGVSGLRMKVQGDKALSAKWADIRKRCDDSLSEPIEVPVRGGEWICWYNCRKCATQLKEREKGVHVCPACGEEHRGQVYDDVVLSGVHSRLSKNIRELGYAYLVTGDRRYAERAKGLLLAYANAIQGPGYRLHDTLGGSSVIGGNVYAEMLMDAVWLVDIIAGYDSVSEILSADERRLVEERIIRKIGDHAYRHDDWQRESFGNHQMWHIAAFGLAAMVLRDTNRLGEARALTDYQLYRGVMSDGGWFEGTFEYHLFAMKAFIDFLCAQANLGEEIPIRYRRMFDYPLAYAGPDRVLPTFNDGYQVVFSRAKQKFDWTDLYDRSRVWTDKVAIDEVIPSDSAVGEESGLAVLRSGANTVVFKFGPHGSWHGHFDKLSVVLWGNGELLSEDPGCCGYGNPKHFGWYKNTLAHNTLSADGRRQEAAFGNLLSFRREKEWSAVAADAGGAIRNATVRRALAMRGNLVFDFMIAESKTEREWEWTFHSRGRFDCPMDVSPVTVPPPPTFPDGVRPDVTDGRDSWSWTRNVREGAHKGAWTASWRTEKTQLALAQLASAPGTLRFAEADGLIGEEGPAKMALVADRIRGRRALFATVMAINGKEAAEVTAVDPNGFSASIGEKVYRLDFDGREVGLTVRKHK